MKWCTKLRVVYKAYPIVLQGDLSNLNDTRVKNITILVPISVSFWITPVSTQRESCNMRNFKGRRRSVSLFFMVIIAFSMSQRPNRGTRPVADIKSLRFAWLYRTYTNDLGISLFTAQMRFVLNRTLSSQHTITFATQRGSQQHIDVVYNTYDNWLGLNCFAGTTPLCSS